MGSAHEMIWTGLHVHVEVFGKVLLPLTANPTFTPPLLSLEVLLDLLLSPPSAFSSASLARNKLYEHRVESSPYPI